MFVIAALYERGIEHLVDSQGMKANTHGRVQMMQ